MSLLRTLLNTFNKEQTSDKQIKVAEQIQKYDGVNLNSLVVFAPKNIEELNRVIDCVAGGQPVIINFGSIKKNEMQSTSDYLSGALYAVRAKINCLQNQLYVIMPKTIAL